MGYFNIEFLRRPELSPLSPKAGYAVGLGAVANSVKDIADIGLNRQKLDDENKRYQEEKLFRNDELNFRKNSHNEMMKARGDELAYQKDKDEKDRIFNEKKLSIDELRANRDRAVDMARVNTQANYYNTLAQERTDKIEQQKQEKAASVEVIRQLFPNETKGKRDAEVLAIGNIMQRFSKNKAATGDDDWVKVNAATYNEYAHLGVARNTKDGYYLNKNFVDELTRESSARSEAKGNQAEYKDRQKDLSKKKPLIFGDDGEM